MELTLRITNAEDLSRFASVLSSFFPAEGQQPLNIDKVTTPRKRRNSTESASSDSQMSASDTVQVAEATETAHEVQTVQTAQISEAAETAPAVQAVQATEAVKKDVVTSSAITAEQMRALVTHKIQADLKNRSEIKAILLKLGAESISTIPEDKREEFMNLVKVL